MSNTSTHTTSSFILRARELRRVFFAPAMLLAALCLAPAAWAQTYLSSFTGITGPTFVAIDSNRTIGGTAATWLYVSEHGDTSNNGGGRILRYNLTSGSATPTV